MPSRASKRTIAEPLAVPTIALAQAFAARGDLQDAANLAESSGSNADDAAASLLAARCALPLGDGERIMRLAKRLPDRFGWIQGAAFWRTGGAHRSDALFAGSLEHLSGDERAEAAFHYAVFLWSKRRLDEVEVLVRAHLQNARGLWRASLEQMLGWVAVSRERFPVATRHFDRALSSYVKSGERDERLHGRLLQALSITALETIDLDLLPAVDIDPPADLGRDARDPWFHAMQNRGWLLMLAGRPSDALNAFLSARVIAPSAATAAVADVNLASFFRIAGAVGLAREHLKFARKHLRTQQWSRADADERMTLIEYALEALRLDPASAGETLTRYLSSTRRRRGDLAFENDRRVAALESMARGSLEAIHERRSSAVQTLGKALEIWSQIGYRYREAVTALLMHDVGNDPKYLAVAGRALASAPKSWLSDEMHRRETVAASGVSKLTPAERRVMLAICEGKTSREIADDFDRSFHTIRNQTLKVYAAMGVRTRTALVAECARLGLIPGTPSSQDP
ncbi:MAG: helix-turn-helix transcriptional regulator [Candidatus Baltobacteraceae bacterium]